MYRIDVWLHAALVPSLPFYIVFFIYCSFAKCDNKSSATEFEKVADTHIIQLVAILFVVIVNQH